MDPTHIDSRMLKIFSLLYCQASDETRVDRFYDILQEGGYAKHTEISANDKDFRIVFVKLCMFVSVDIFEVAYAARKDP